MFGLSNWKDGIVVTEMEPMLDECQGMGGCKGKEEFSFSHINLKCLLDIQVDVKWGVRDTNLEGLVWR